MRNKVITGIVIILAIFAGILTFIFIKKDKNIENNDNFAVEDECLDEEYMYEIGMYTDDLEASSAEEKLSPNAEFIIRKKYKECGHITEEIAELPEEMVNRNQEEIEGMYKDFELEAFSKDEIVLYKEVDGICNEHYKIKEENGILVVYLINSIGEEFLYYKTSISTKYLPETDLEQIKDGLSIYGKKNLNKFIEDFE